MGSGGKLYSFWCDACQCYVPFSDYDTAEANCWYCEAKADKARANAAEAALAAAQAERAEAVAAARAEGNTTVPHTAEQERQAIIAWLRKQGGRAAWTLVGEIEKCAHLWGTNREG